MTSWQWKVILALCRLLLKVEERTNEDNDEHIDIGVSEDIAILHEAIEPSEAILNE